MACRGCGNKSSSRVAQPSPVDMTLWVEVIPIQDGTIPVPEWDNVRVHSGEPVRLPQYIVAKYQDFFKPKEDAFVDKILGRSVKVKASKVRED